MAVYNIAIMTLCGWFFTLSAIFAAATTLVVGAELAPPGPAKVGPYDSQITGPANNSLTAVPGIKVGHHTLAERPTGCTVVLIEDGATAGVDVRGAAPATRDTDLLNPTKMVERDQGSVCPPLTASCAGRRAFDVTAQGRLSPAHPSSI